MILRIPIILIASFLCLYQNQLFALDALIVTKVTPQVYSAIGVSAPPNYENGGHNNNLSFVIGNEAVLVVNGGASYRLAKRLHLAIKKITYLPVKWVVDENGQGHAFLGNSYWQEQGATLIAHNNAVLEIRERGAQILSRMQKQNKDKSKGTFVAVPSVGFDDVYKIDLGGVNVELRYFGPAHSPGDISVWLPKSGVLITGDIAFHQRLLAIFPDTNVASWITSFDAMTALAPKFIVPGHGAPTDLVHIRATTQNYLKFLTKEVEMILENDGDLADAYAIDQSAYAHLHTFNELATKNAGRLFQTLEMESF